MWAAVNALDAVCVRDRAAGMARVTGRLFVQLDRQYNKGPTDAAGGADNGSDGETA